MFVTTQCQKGRERRNEENINKQNRMMEGKNERQGEGKMVERWEEEWDE